MLSQEQLHKLWIGPNLDWAGAMTRNKVQAVDQLALNELIKNHSSSWKHMAGYEGVSKSQAVKGDSLALLHPFIDDLLDLAPTGEINTSQLKTAIMAAVFNKPELNNTTQKNDIWCSLRIDRITTMLYHTRRLLDIVKFQQMVAGSQGASVVILKALLEKLQPQIQPPETGLPFKGDEVISEAPSKDEDMSMKGGNTTEDDDKMKCKTSSPALSSHAFKQLWNGSSSTTPMKEKPKAPKITPAKKVCKDSNAKKVQNQSIGQAIFRKEFYKANNSYGIKKIVQGKAKQIFSLCGKTGWSRDQLTVLADKVLHDLSRCKTLAEEEEIELLAKYKLGH